MKENILELIRTKENNLRFNFLSMFSIFPKFSKGTKKDLVIFVKEECEKSIGGFDAD